MYRKAQDIREKTKILPPPPPPHRKTREGRTSKKSNQTVDYNPRGCKKWNLLLSQWTLLHPQLWHTVHYQPQMTHLYWVTRIAHMNHRVELRQGTLFAINLGKPKKKNKKKKSEKKKPFPAINNEENKWRPNWWAPLRLFNPTVFSEWMQHRLLIGNGK